MNVTLRLGVGDIVLSKSLLCSSPPPVNVWLKYSFLFYRGPGYKNFVSQFARDVFHDKPFLFFDDQREVGPSLGWEELYERGMRGSPINLSPLCEKGEKVEAHLPYLCLNMKARWVHENDFLKDRDRLVSILTSLAPRLRTIFIGERDVEGNPEYTEEIKNGSIFSLWKHVIGKIPNAMDLTVPRLGITSPEMGKLRTDCRLMRESIASISLGFGGNTCLATALAGKSINLLGHGPREDYRAKYAACLLQMAPRRCQNFDKPNGFLEAIRSLG